MRITSANMFDSSMANLQKRQEQLARSQEQLTTGKRVSKASDDPTSAARGERAQAMIARVDANLRALEASRSVMQQTETALGDASDLLQQARDQFVNAGNASYSDNERKTLATALRGIRTQLLSVSNRGDGAGGYLFGGQGSSTAPFVDSASGVQYAGTTGTLRASTDEPLPLSVDGQQAFLGAPNPVVGQPPVSAFDVLDGMIATLETPGQSSTVLVSAVHDRLAELDSVMGNVFGYRSQAGEALKRADSMEARLSQVKLNAETERSSAEDLDMVASISAFQSQQTGYDAALKTYAMVQRLSLFDYLGR